MTTSARLPFPISMTGDGVHLREWRPDDLQFLVALLDEPEIARFTPMPSPFDFEAAEAYLARAKQARLSGQRMQLAITVDGGEPLGEVLLFGLNTSRREVELGYLVGAQHRRQGLASRSLALLIGYARHTLGVERLLLRIDASNAASVAVARRAGFRITTDPPIQQAGPHGTSSLDTWELVDPRAGSRVNRLRNVATRRYGRRSRPAE
ncbi:MAG TPA: GNAT family N-acetyltransferase [Actinoplanes sp.]|nr:GNAT family N-acetyltransferase [Actinoplanes sp.]